VAANSPVSDIRAATEYLARLGNRYFSRAPFKQIVFGNTPAADIIAYAKRNDIKLIVIADGGNRSIGQMLLFDGTVPLLKVPIEQSRT
jgi:nucleotide-binding universal stress UspA family protein